MLLSYKAELLGMTVIIRSRQPSNENTETMSILRKYNNYHKSHKFSNKNSDAEEHDCALGSFQSIFSYN